MWFTLFLIFLLVEGEGFWILWIRQRRRLVDRGSYLRESFLSGSFQNGKAEDALSLVSRKKTEIKIENANGILGKPTSSNDVFNIVTLYLMVPPEYSYSGYELL